MRANIFLFVAMFGFSPAVSLAATNTPVFDTTAFFSSALANMTNQIRIWQNLPALAKNPLLDRAAQMKAESMAEEGYFAHTSPTGQTPWYWFDHAGYRYEYAGENLAMNYINPTDVENAWIASPSHYANLVDTHYTEVGTDIAYGVYKGKPVVYIAQVYASPAPYRFY